MYNSVVINDDFHEILGKSLKLLANSDVYKESSSVQKVKKVFLDARAKSIHVLFRHLKYELVIHLLLHFYLCFNCICWVVYVVEDFALKCQSEDPPI